MGKKSLGILAWGHYCNDPKDIGFGGMIWMGSANSDNFLQIINSKLNFCLNESRNKIV